MLGSDRCCARLTRPLPALGQQSEPGIARDRGAHDIGRGVGRSVIDHKRFKILEGLGLQAVDGRRRYISATL